MLQQILRDMWVDPEILAELDEAQKQTLFCKMREEQVRRWQLWDQKVGGDEDSPKFQKNGKKQVQFMKGEDGEPWVWVMGEHPDDKTIESILAEEARKRALTQAREEAHQLRKSVEKELTHLIDYKPLDTLEQKFDLSPKSIESIEDNLEIYCTVDELRQRIDALEPEVTSEKELGESLEEKTDYCNENINHQLDLNKNTLHFNFIEGKRDVLQELGIPNTGSGVSVRVAAWERRVAAARAGDILRTLRARRARTLRDAQLHAGDGDEAWREQERKAKEAEATMRQIARAAREAHRRSAGADLPAAAAHLHTHTPQAGKPPSREAVLEWFRTQELKRGVGIDEDNKPVEWFHGLITRSEAEQILSAQATGSFLVRISERVWGYAISYSCGPAPGPGLRCKHYLVEAHGGTYRLLGTAQMTHTTLERKAKEAEATMRQIARAAREAHRRSAGADLPAAAAHLHTHTPQAGKPPSREAVLEWFRTQELKRGVGIDEDNKPVEWFHGLITRSEAEQILSAQATGSFLVRISERVWGYAISYSCGPAPGPGLRCKHYLVEAHGGTYRLLGTAQMTHTTLADLINYHKAVVITESGGELLTSPCPPTQPPLLSAPPS